MDAPPRGLEKQHRKNKSWGHRNHELLWWQQRPNPENLERETRIDWCTGGENRAGIKGLTKKPNPRVNRISYQVNLADIEQKLKSSRTEGRPVWTRRQVGARKISDRENRRTGAEIWPSSALAHSERIRSSEKRKTMHRNQTPEALLLFALPCTREPNPGARPRNQRERESFSGGNKTGSENFVVGWRNRAEVRKSFIRTEVRKTLRSGELKDNQETQTAQPRCKRMIFY
jgi:hypothetical protein